MPHDPIVDVVERNGRHLIVTRVQPDLNSTSDGHRSLAIDFQVVVAVVGVLFTPLPQHVHSALT